MSYTYFALAIEIFIAIGLVLLPFAIWLDDSLMRYHWRQRSYEVLYLPGDDETIPIWKLTVISILIALEFIVTWPYWAVKNFPKKQPKYQWVYEPDAYLSDLKEKLGYIDDSGNFQKINSEAYFPTLFNNRVAPGDEIWSFSTNSQSWENLAGRSGIAVVRDGTIVFDWVTIMN